MEIVLEPVNESIISNFEIPDYEPDDLDTRSALAAILSNEEQTALSCISRIVDARRLQYCLYRAVVHSRSSAVRAILRREGVALDKQALAMAIESGSTAMLSLFLEMGWDINKELGPWEPPPLSLAVNDRDMVQWFLHNGANPAARCKLDLTPLSTAIELGSFEVIKLMMRDTKEIRSGQLLHHAARRAISDCVDVSEETLARGADVNGIMYQHDINSYLQLHRFGLGTPLHEAAKSGNVDIVEALARHNANPWILDSRGMTPMQIAEVMQQSRAYDALNNLAKQSEPPTVQPAAAMELPEPEV